MKKCPQCQVDLADADLTQGKCSQCGASLTGAVMSKASGEDDTGATIGDVSASQQPDDASQDDGGGQTIEVQDTRKDKEDALNTIGQDAERSTVDDPDMLEQAAGRSAGEQAVAGQTIDEVEAVGKDPRPEEEGAASKTVADVNNTFEVSSGEQQDVGKTVEDQEIGKTIDESALSKDEKSKTVEDVDKTIELSGEDDGGKTIEMAGDGDEGKTIEVSGAGPDSGKTVSESPIGGQTVEVDETGRPVDPSKKTVPASDINQTIDVPDAEAKDDGTGTVNEVNANATIDISGPQPGKPGTVADKSAVPTLGSTEVVANVQQHINKTWGGSFDEEDTPRTSLKTNVFDDPTGTKSDLVIQPRMFGKADEPRKRSSVDYDLLEMLGEGGMGLVYAARQASIDRTVAVKMLKPKTAQDEVQRCKFLAEAVVTGDLEHPNIVPIYDLGRNAEGALFYAMKRVQGTPWDEVIAKKSLHENIEILMKVADAVGFSHSRGIIHRDLKPENVMLGDFGEVLVMDWGLAVPTDSRLIGGLRPSTGMGGTPAYMAPEMATGPFERIGIHSDVYLLGAILFEAVTGKPPHTGRDVMKCLFAAAKNKIQEVEHPSELVDIAMKAMSTDPADRHGSVIEFQDAIRRYLSHSESILLSDHAEQDLATASRTNDYQDYSRALFGFQQAIELWDGNEPAKEGLSLTQVAYATSARDKGDFDLGASLLDAEKPEQVELLSEIREAKREVEARQQRLKTTKRALMALAATVFFVVLGALGLVLKAKAETERQKVLAEKNEREAVKQKGIAEVNLVLAKKNEAEAIEEREKAEAAALAEKKAKEEAVLERKRAEAAALAEKKAKETAEAAALAEKKAKEEAEAAALAEMKAKVAAERAALAETKAKDEAITARKKAEAAALAEKKAKEAAEKAALAEKKAKDEAVVERKKAEAAALAEKKAKEEAEAAALAEKKAKDEAVLERKKAEAAALAEKKAKEKAELEEQKARLAEAEAKRQAYTALISAAAGKIEENAFDSAREDLKKCDPIYRNWEWGRLWHLCNQSVAVMDAQAEIAAIDFSPVKEDEQFATGSLDGKVRIWRLNSGMSGSTLVRTLDTGRDEVFSLAFSPDGKQIAVGTGSSDGYLQIWDVDSGKPVARIASGKRDGMLSKNTHTQDVVSVQFDASGDLLLTSSYDATAKVWDVTDRAHPKVLSTLRGHTWWVWSASFSPDRKKILTVSDDGNAIVWTDQTGKWEHDENIKASPKFRGHTGPIFAGAFSPDGETVATAGYGQRVLLWKPSELKEFDHEAAVASFNPDHPFRSTDSTNAKVLEGHTGPVRSLTFSNDGALLLTAGEDNTIRVWNIEQDVAPVVLRGHGKAVQGCDISPKSQWIVSGSLDGTARLWDLTRYEEQRVLRGDVLEGHGDAVLSAYFTSAAAYAGKQGRRVVTASRDGTAKTWNLDDKQVEKTFTEGHTLREGHLFRAAQAEFFAEDKYLATSAVDNTVRIWDVSRGTQIDLLEGTGRNAALAVSGDGSLIVTGSDIEDEGSSGFHAQVWQWKKGEKSKLLFKLGNHLKTVTQVAVSPDKRFIATGDANGHCNLWDAQTGKLARGLSWHVNGITALDFLPDSSRLVSGDGEGNVVQWDLKSYQPLKQLTIQLGDGVTSMDTAELPDSGKRAVVLCTDDGRVELYDVDRGSRGKLRMLTARYRFGTPDDAHFSPDGSRVMVVATPLADAAEAGTEGEANVQAAGVHMFDSQSGEEMEFKVAGQTRGPFLFLGSGSSVSSASFNSDGTRVVTVGGNRAQMWKTDPAVDQAEREVMRFRSHGPIATARFSPDAESKYIVTGSWDTTIKIWDTTNNQNQLTLKDLHTRAVNSVRLFQDKEGMLALSASDDGTAKLWPFDPEGVESENATVRALVVFAHESEVTDAIFIASRNQVVTTSRDGGVRVWDRPDLDGAETPVIVKKPARELRGAEDRSAGLLCVAASYDGRWIVAGGEKDAKLWDLDAEGVEPFDTLTGHTAPVTSVEFSGKDDRSRRLLTGSEDFTAKVWDTSKLWEEPPKLEGKELELDAAAREVNEIMTLKGHSRAVTSVTFSPDGKYCLTASHDGTAIVWLTSDWKAKASGR